MMINVIGVVNDGYTKHHVSDEVNLLWGTSNPLAEKDEDLLPDVAAWTEFDGKVYFRCNMPREHAQALQDLTDGHERFAGYQPESATVIAIQWGGPEKYYLGEEPQFKEDGSPLMIPATWDEDGNVLTEKQHSTPVYVGDIP